MAPSSSPGAPNYQDDLRMGFINFVTHLQYLSEVFNNAEKYRTDRSEIISSLINENSLPEFYEKYGQESFTEYANLELWYKPMLIQSFFLIAYSSFESQIHKIALQMEAQFSAGPKIPPKGKGQSDIGNFRKYLNTTHHVKKAIENIQWNRINEFRLIRNSIVHKGGKIPTKDIPTLTNLLVAYNVTYNSDPLPFLIRNQNFLFDFISVVKEYLKQIIFEIAPVPPPQLPPITHHP